MSSVVYIRQVLEIANMNYTVLVRNSLKKVSRLRLAVRPLSLVAACDIKELMHRDWATLRRCGTLLWRDRHS